MRKFIPALICSLIILTSCEDRSLQTYVANVPVYMSYKELRSGFTVSGETSMEKPGKITYYNNHLFINEYQQGVHVVDVSDPSTPDIIAFIAIPGNVDLAIRNNTLYAESYVDLLEIDISDPSNPVLVQRMEDLFEYVIPPYDYEFPLAEIDQEKGVIISYEIKKTTREVDRNPYPWPIFWGYDMAMSSSTGSEIAGNSYGIGGSMARFICYDDYLYTLENNYILNVLDVDTGSEIDEETEIYLGGNVETLFINGEFMYVGTSNGMHIMSLSNPEKPALLSTYRHITACDPVVVEADRAYITLRSGNNCGGEQNLLEVLDISDKFDPERQYSYSMTEPYGLGIDNNILFICEGEHGLRVYDATDAGNIKANLLADFKQIHAYDVIPMGQFLLLIGDDGLYTYDYQDPQNITLLGSLPVDAG